MPILRDNFTYSVVEAFLNLSYMEVLAMEMDIATSAW